MDPAITAALITGAVTVLVVMITNAYQNRRIVQLMEIKLALINQSIETLSDRVNKHNNLIDRTYKLEADSEVLQEKMKVADHRIADLEAKE